MGSIAALSFTEGIQIDDHQRNLFENVFHHNQSLPGCFIGYIIFCDKHRSKSCPRSCPRRKLS